MDFAITVDRNPLVGPPSWISNPLDEPVFDVGPFVLPIFLVDKNKVWWSVPTSKHEMTAAAVEAKNLQSGN